MHPTVIAIDGPSASGKGTIARKLAAHFGFAHLDTGLLYRAVAVAVIRTGGDPADPVAAQKAALALNPANLATTTADPALRNEAASTGSSKVAAIPEVRAALLQFQKDFCAEPPDGKAGAVLDGRDIGTVIAPDAKVKIFVTATTEARALRRFNELRGRGETAIHEAVLNDMRARDARDNQRATAPALPAADAVIIDTTNLNAEQAYAHALQIAQSKLTP